LFGLLILSRISCTPFVQLVPIELQYYLGCIGCIEEGHLLLICPVDVFTNFRPVVSFDVRVCRYWWRVGARGRVPRRIEEKHEADNTSECEEHHAAADKAGPISPLSPAHT